MTDSIQIDDDLCALVKAVDREKTALARRLHDSLSQNLAAASMTLSVLERAAQPSNAEVARECAKLINICIDEVRNTCFRLSPPLAGQTTLTRAMHCLVETLQKQSGVPIRVRVTGDHTFSEEAETAMLRITQDACRALAASGAAGIEVEADVWDDRCSVVIRGSCVLRHIEDSRVLECVLRARAQCCGAAVSLLIADGTTEIRMATPGRELS